MSPIPPYEYRGPVQATSTSNLTSLGGKSVVITGGASGLGRASAQAFVNAGAYVSIGDLNDDLRSNAVAELGRNAQSVHCDVRNWKEQVSLFEAAMANSPHRRIDIVVANAGLGAIGDPLVAPEGPDSTLPPSKPDLTILDVNLKGTLYTSRLAQHFFRRQTHQSSPELHLTNGHQQIGIPTPTGDNCLILMSSMSAYIDWKFSLQYPVSKAGVRTLMKCLRRSAWADGARVNMVAPGYIDTPMIPAPLKQLMLAQGMEFGQTEDVVRAVMRIATDSSVNGRSFGVFDRKRCPEGYMDLDADDYREGDLIYPMEKIALQMKFRRWIEE